MSSVEGLHETFKYSRGSSRKFITTMKGLWYGTALAGVTSIARGMQLERARIPLSKHITPEGGWAQGMKYFKTGGPIIIGSVTGFFLLRDSFEQSSPDTY